MSRRRPDPIWVQQERPGHEAKEDGDCSRCSDPILKGDRIVPHKGHWIHARCRSGGSDE